MSSTPRSSPHIPSTSRRCSALSTVRATTLRRRPAIVALETKLAAAHWDVVKRRDADLTYNLRTFADLPAEAPGFDWAGWVAALGATPNSIAELVVRQPDYLTAFAAAWSAGAFEDWKSWLRWRLINARAFLLTDDLVAEDFAFYGRRLSGTEQIRDRWKRAVSIVEGLMGDAVGKLYVERHFPPLAKARMDELVANLREAYRVSINSLEWMTPQTREKALAKLDKFTPKIGYPDEVARLFGTRDRTGRPLRQLSARLRRRIRPRTGQVGRPGRPRRMVHDAADRQRLLQPRHERDRLSRSDSAAAVLRRRGRRRSQLRRHRRGHRPRDRARVRRPGRQVRRRRQPGGLVDRRRTAPSSARGQRL